MKKVCLSGLCLFIVSIPASARLIEDWPYKRLFEKAEVVVIASARTTVNTDDQMADSKWKKGLIGQNTTLAVINVLKGNVGSDQLTILHFKLQEGLASQNGPLLVAFRTKGPHIKGSGYDVQLETPQYLLFLKRRSDGRFEPVTGQVDAELSVKEIYSPLPEHLNGP